MATPTVISLIKNANTSIRAADKAMLKHQDICANLAQLIFADADINAPIQEEAKRLINLAKAIVLTAKVPSSPKTWNYTSNALILLMRPDTLVEVALPKVKGEKQYKHVKASDPEASASIAKLNDSAKQVRELEGIAKKRPAKKVKAAKPVVAAVVTDDEALAQVEARIGKKAFDKKFTAMLTRKGFRLVAVSETPSELAAEIAALEADIKAETALAI